MHVCLVSAPIITSYQADEQSIGSLQKVGLYPPLGLLVLAGKLEAIGYRVTIIHPDLEYMGAIIKATKHCFVPNLMKKIVATNADVIGFSSICSSYPLTVRLSRIVREELPRATIVLGGPQASVVDLETLESFQWIDFIVRGEADESFPELVASLDKGWDATKVVGVTFRSKHGIFRAPDARLVDDLDRVSSPAYHLYEASAQLEKFSLELGRGCPFSCEFCSTNLFFSKRFRLRSPEVVFFEMQQINERYGVSDFELVHDMFTVDRKRVVAFCQYFIERGAPFTWSCSARTDRTDEELLQLMFDAGCRGVFFGIETGSQRLQTIIRKNINIDQAKRIVVSAERIGLNATASLITGFHEETEEDLCHTIDFFVDMLRLNTVEPQLHLLSPLPGTPIAKQFSGSLSVSSTLSDMAFNGNRPDEEDAALIRSYPHIFSAYLQVPTILDRVELSEFRDFLMNSRWQLRYLLVLLHSSGQSLLTFFREWRATCGDQYVTLTQSQRVESMLAFSEKCAPRLASSVRTPTISLINLLQAINRKRGQLLESSENHHKPVANYQSDIEMTDNDVPSIERDVLLYSFDGDYSTLIESIRCFQAPQSSDGLEPQLLLVRLQDDGGVWIEHASRTAAALLLSCNHSARVADIVATMEDKGHLTHLPPEKRKPYVKLGLHLLAQKKVVRLRV